MAEIAVEKQSRLASIESKCGTQVQGNKRAAATAGDGRHHDDAILPLGSLEYLCTNLAECLNRIIAGYFRVDNPALGELSPAANSQLAHARNALARPGAPLASSNGEAPRSRMGNRGQFSPRLRSRFAW